MKQHHSTRRASASVNAPRPGQAEFRFFFRRMIPEAAGSDGTLLGRIGEATPHSPVQLLAGEDASSLLSESRSPFLRQGGRTPLIPAGGSTHIPLEDVTRVASFEEAAEKTEATGRPNSKPPQARKRKVTYQLLSQLVFKSGSGKAAARKLAMEATRTEPNIAIAQLELAKAAERYSPSCWGYGGLPHSVVNYLFLSLPSTALLSYTYAYAYEPPMALPSA
ncbi:hypothetical protein MRB53_036521 [Persea americana]|nr:hypothetical protein MRB53_037219 [Persea americana]KAJ8613842.1 hypothetical protein MRB53_036799 [Persea americana]KAJ8614655.1 hypothetical protein MRB53_036521 [Persea americana]